MVVRLAALMLLSAALCLAAPGCGRNSSSPADPASPAAPADTPVSEPFGSGLPAPSALLAGLNDDGEGSARSTSYLLSDLYQTGDQYDSSLPNNEVFLIGDDLALDSWLPPEECELDDVAYAGFHFEVPGFDRSARVILSWTDEPLEPEYWFIALANWDTDRWDWYTGNPDNRVITPSMDPYLTFDGDCIVMVFCTGPLNGLLDRVRLGGLEPVAVLDASNNRGSVPLVVHLDAGDSLAVDGTITSYEWDVDGDGEFEVNTGLSDSINPTFIENGEVRVQVRVTNSHGATDTDGATVEAIGDWAHSWGLSKDDELMDVLQTSDGSIFAVGSSKRTTGDNDKNLLLMRISPVGILVWARTWDASGIEEGNRIVQMDSGDLVVAGSIFRDGSTDVLLQRWSRSGQVVWSRKSGGSELDEATGLFTDANNIYIAGNTRSTPGGTFDIFAARLDQNGEHFWGYGRDRGNSERVADLVPRRDHNGQIQMLVVLANSWDIEDVHPWKVEYDYDGIHNTSQDLNVTDFMFEARALHHVGSKEPADERYYVLGEIIDGEDKYSGLLCSTGTAATHYTYLWWTGGDCQLRDLLLYDSSTIVNCGWIEGATRPGTLWYHQESDGQVTTVRRWEGTYTTNLFGLNKSRYDGVVTVGRTQQADGNWVTGPGNFSSFTAQWVSSGSSEHSNLLWTWDLNINGTVENITTEFGKFEDEGAGGDDVFMAHRQM